MDELYVGTEERQTELETELDALRDEPVVQTETVSDAPSAEDGMDPERADAVPSQSGTERQRERRARPAPVVSIDDRLGVETDADKARDAMLDLVESLKTRRILSGTVQGIERPGDGANSVAVIYHGDFKVLIPAEEMVERPEEAQGRSVSDALHYMLNKRLGAEVDYIVKGIDVEAGIAVASRLEAMAAKRREYYFGTDRDGNNLLYNGVCAEARVVSVIRAGIFADVFGVETYIPLRELSYQPGQRILVKLMDIDRSDRSHIRVSASIKRAGENPYEKALKRYLVGNRYVGTASMVDTTGVFVALDGGIDCLCSYPKRGRPPRGSRGLCAQRGAASGEHCGECAGNRA